MPYMINARVIEIKTIKTDSDDILGIVIAIEDEFGRYAEIYSHDIRIGDEIHLSFGDCGGISLSDRLNENAN